MHCLNIQISSLTSACLTWYIRSHAANASIGSIGSKCLTGLEGDMHINVSLALACAPGSESSRAFILFVLLAPILCHNVSVRLDDDSIMHID